MKLIPLLMVFSLCNLLPLHAGDHSVSKGFVLVPVAPNAAEGVRVKFNHKHYRVSPTPIITGADIRQATLDLDETGKGIVRSIDLGLTPEGAGKMADWISNAKSREVAAIIEGKVISIFTVTGPDSSGGLAITGNLSRHDAHKYVKKINRHAAGEKK
ncbi:MAG: hypothetical protein SFY92_00895 [Verrucomicrobiae bacterium]|nr:hypothetical protein [Verrucomicrobiae bacterium]